MLYSQAGHLSLIGRWFQHLQVCRVLIAHHDASLTLKLKHQYLGHLMGRADSLEKIQAWKDGRQEEKKVTEDEIVR